MSVNKATAGAIAISGTTLLLCLYAVAAIYGDIQDIWSELDAEMDQFRLEADAMWRDMLAMGAGTPANRERREAYETEEAKYAAPVQTPPVRVSGTSYQRPGLCQCSAVNNCPAGAAGPPGERGPEGLPGLPGKEGVPGEAMENVQNEPFKGCISCPMGPTGPAGAAGKPGVRGMRGQKGLPGYPGRDGIPGIPGEQGGTGEAGKDGKAGEPGEKGADEKKLIGRKGPQGAPGELGPEGPVGDQGKTGTPGAAGPPGLRGPTGAQGVPGVDGEEGRLGTNGQHGKDAAYCPCPNRVGGAADVGGGQGAYGGAVREQPVAQKVGAGHYRQRKL